METLTEQLGTAGVALLGVVVLVQLTLQVIALVQLARTPADRVSLGGRKWAWLLIIVLGEIIGSVLWFVLGRTQGTASDVAASGDAASQRSAVDALYGQPRER
jgi:hypothetical protein